MSDSTTEREVELGGQKYLCTKRTTRGVVEYTFNLGVTWHETMADAYEGASRGGNLARVGDLSAAGEFEGWFVGLAREIQALKPGGSLKVLRDGSAFLVLREEVVSACRASAVDELELGEGGGGQGGSGLSVGGGSRRRDDRDGGSPDGGSPPAGTPGDRPGEEPEDG